MPVHIGTSGWNYPSGRGTWNGVFYPKTRSKKAGTHAFDELRFYAEHFDTVEINSTFYRVPTAATAKSWAQRTPPGFEFSLKLYQKFTHPKMFEKATGGDAASLGQKDVDEFRAALSRWKMPAATFVYTYSVAAVPPALPATDGAPPATPRARLQSGEATRNLFRLQASGQQAGQRLPILGDQATLSYARYLKSFEHEIPDFFETDVARSKDASSLYDKLEQVIIPLFYHNRDRFIDVMLHSIALNGSFFNTHRMIQQYVLKAYFE